MSIKSWIQVIIAFQILTTIRSLMERIEEDSRTVENVTSGNHTEIISETTTVPFIDSCECGRLLGIFPTGKIVGGTMVHLGRNPVWPWFVALVHESRPEIAHCGGSLISQRYLITAGHCILPMIQFGLRHFRAKLGYNDLTINAGDGQANGLDVGIEAAWVHPKFEQAYPFHFDMGLVKLSHLVKCNKHIRPICLPMNDSTASNVNSTETITAVTTGFGKTQIDGNYSRTLLQIEIDLISNEECRQRFSKLSYTGPPILDNMVCAWGKGKDSCVGDSGGPLFVQKDTKDQRNNIRYEQIGVTSWGAGCANEAFPGVYSKVYEFLPWIKSNVVDLKSD